MTVIAMTREMGSLGKEIARDLADHFESRLVYHELIGDPPEPSHLDEPSEVKRHLGNGSDTNGASHRNGRMTPVELLELASRGNVIIRGWGAVRLLHQIPHIFCVRVCAPMQDRVDEIVRRLGVSERNARREIHRSDDLHSNVFERLSGGDWRDALNYDMVVNTARVRPEDAADLIVEAVSRPTFQETDESRQILADRLSEARIASFLANDPDLAGACRNVYVSVSGSAVTLYGAVRGWGLAREIGAAVQAHADVAEVRNSIQTIGDYISA